MILHWSDEFNHFPIIYLINCDLRAFKGSDVLQPAQRDSQETFLFYSQHSVLSLPYSQLIYSSYSFLEFLESTSHPALFHGPFRAWKKKSTSLPPDSFQSARKRLTSKLQQARNTQATRSTLDSWTTQFPVVEIDWKGNPVVQLSMVQLQLINSSASRVNSGQLDYKFPIVAIRLGGKPCGPIVHSPFKSQF